MQKKIFIFFVFLVLSVFCLAAAAIAQEAPKQEVPKAPEKQFVDVSGQVFFQWAKALTVSDTASNDHEVSQFSLQRAYLNFNKKFDDVLSAKVTTDIENTGYGTDSANTTYKLYIKYAYAQAKQDFGPTNLTLRFGMIDTPVISFIENISDASWIYSNYISKSSDLFKGSKLSIDTPADMGASLCADIIKMVRITGLYTNGNGYKSTAMEDRSNTADNKQYKNYGNAWQGMITVTPIDGLSAFGFYRNQDWNKNTDGNYIIYYGAGAAYSTKLIKAGATYSLPEKTTKSTTVDTKARYSLLDSWVNVNLDPVIRIPILLYGRYAVGKAENNQAEKDMGTKYGKSTTLYGIGAGYVVSGNMRLMAFYQSTKYKEANKADTDLFVKTEIKF